MASSATKRAPALGAGEMLRWFWTQLTSMRTALILLFLLALAAIPGSIVPQRSFSPIRVNDFREAHPNLDRIYQPLGVYDVYTSPWFSAIYLLLFASLIGCILPRIRQHVRALRTPPPRVPARLDRLPEYAGAAAASTAPGLTAAHAFLKERRFLVARSENGISAERGRWRETGNLLFHTSLIFVLVGVAWSNLYGYKGSAMVVEGQGFSNTLTQYDELRAGAFVDTNALEPFTVILDSFTVSFETGEVQRGAARQFDAEVTVVDGGQRRKELLQVNHPVRVAGRSVHLISHGYAAQVTIRDGDGRVALSGPVIFLPQDGNFTSAGVIKAPDARPERLAFEGFFLPTATVDDRGPRSVFPDAYNPELFLNAWTGPPKKETGLPENVYSLDTSGLEPVQLNGDLARFRLKVGEYYTLPDQMGSVTFDGWSRWAKLQTSSTPGLWLTVGSIAAAIVGLCLSLFIRPRRLWIRLVQDNDGARFEAGGLDRADASTGLAEDVRGLLAAAVGDPSPNSDIDSDHAAVRNHETEGEQ